MVPTYINKSEEKMLSDVLFVLETSNLTSDQEKVISTYKEWFEKTLEYSVKRRANEAEKILEKRKINPKYCQNYVKKSK